MKVTEAGRDVLLSNMKRLGKSVCHLGVREREDGNRGLTISLINKEEATRIIHVGGVDFDVSIEDELALEGYTFDGVGSHLKAIPPYRPCR